MVHESRHTIKKIARRLDLIQPLVHRQREVLPPFRYAELDGPQINPAAGMNLDDGDWTIIHPNTYWGAWRTNYVMRTEFQAPAAWTGDLPLALHLPLGEAGDFSHPEALVYIDGSPVAACDRHHQEIYLPAQYLDGRMHLLVLHGWTGQGGATRGYPGTQLFMRPCALVQVDQPTRDFIATARTALGIAENLDENEPARAYLLNALDEAFNLLDTREPFAAGFYDSVVPAHAVLRAGILRSGSPLNVEIVATGHAHIDVAWLWTLGQTRHKAGRTFHTVNRLMEEFPEYHFTQSQPQLYDFVRQDYPALFEAIRSRVAEGRWEPIGGMWVEADCNLSGSESLARQLLLGRTFFRQHFGRGAESPVLWLPDVFGFNANLPQLMRSAGLPYFFTIKLGWNRYNRLPYDSFWWQGLDGTRVLAHFGTTPENGQTSIATYNASVTPRQVLGTWTNFQQKELRHRLLMAYGYGDGGGGPTREMLENIREMASFPATPRTCQGSVREFFQVLEAEEGDRLPTWNGELYLELHRGTYTTQSRNKRANRKSEFLLHDVEFLSVFAGLLDVDFRYPVEDLRRAWEAVCLNQFHDIIPGSSITQVYRESQIQYEEIERSAHSLIETASAAIAGEMGGDVLIANPTGFACRDLAFWPYCLEPGQRLLGVDGRVATVQATTAGTWIDAGELEAYSVTPFCIVADAEAQGVVPPPGMLVALPSLLENDFLRVELDAAGDISRIFDKVNQREVLPAGCLANQFQAFEDRPVDWDAWDVDIFFDDRMWLSDPAVSIAVVDAGPLRATIEIRRRILNSDYVQRISLSHHSPRLDIETVIDWRERHILLKAAFPVDILAPWATYEIQWGNVQRPTHRNTSWDWARFENPAQKWVDLSEGDYGVSLINDCKYGHDIRDNVIRISLLRSPTAPDPEADQGSHRFTYSLLPHTGSWNETTVAAAYALNDPLIVLGLTDGAKGLAVSQSLLSVDRPNVVVETIKQAEAGNGIIVRLYESQRRRGPVVLTAGFDLAAAWRTNLLEEDEYALKTDGRQVGLFLKPYEIATLRLVPADR